MSQKDLVSAGGVSARKKLLPGAAAVLGTPQ